MMETLPFYVTAVFVLSTLFTIGILFRAFSRVRPAGFASRLIAFLLPFWMVITAVLAIGGFYAQMEARPPRVIVFGVLPAVLLIAAYFILFRNGFLDRLSLQTLTWLHVVRIPVEFGLLMLFQHGLIPQEMTFEGRNFDILSGITAVIIAFIGFRGGRINRPLLIVWNLFALALLINIVSVAILSFPTPFQRFGFEQPNVGVAYFPFIWLPTIIVPAVLFAHLVALFQLFRRGTDLVL
jgi:hypothetical protein